MNSIYELDPKWKGILTLDNFLGGLTVHEFVQALSKDHSLKGTATGTWEQLDPKPYIRTFESTLKELKNLSTESNSNKGQLSQQVSQYELIHAQNVMTLSTNLKSMVQDYDHLDNKLTNVIQVVSPLGEKLEKSIKRKNSYVRSVELISHYNSFYSQGSSVELEKLRVSKGWKSKARAAVLVKNLLALTRKIETKSLDKTLETTAIIEKYSETMENELLANFNTAYRDNDFNKLNEIALILNHFNGGVNVIQSFINQHEYFIDTKQLDVDESGILVDEDFKSKISDPDNHSLFYEKTMVERLESIENVIKNESKVVKVVFEERAQFVLQLFIQRIFAQKIESNVDLLLSASLSISNLAHVRMLHALYSLIGQFVKDLSEFFQAIGLDQDGGLTSTLEQYYSDLFSKTIFNRSKYFDIEKRSLEITLAQKTADFNLAYDREIRPRYLVNKLSNKASITSNAELHALNATSSGKLFQINNFFKSHLDRDRKSLTRSSSSSQLPSNGPAISGTETAELSHDEDPKFTLHNIDSMLKCAVESLARVMELVPNKAGDFSFELLEVVLMGVINSYVESGLEYAYFQLSRIDASRTEDINLSYFKYVSKSAEILSLVSAATKTIILPLLNNSPQIKRKIVTLINAYFKRCEMLINVILEETVQLYSHKFTNSLSKQKKKDFIPRSQEILDQDTLPAIEIVACLNSLYAQTILHLKKENLKFFLMKVGTDLYQQLLEHFKKYQVNSIGGIILTKDIIGYQNAIEEWKIQELLDDFATLRELANLFTVQPELLDSLTKEGRLSNVGADIISEYIAKREDFNHESFVTKFRLNLKS